jgi:predicted metal-dependent peptidase
VNALTKMTDRDRAEMQIKRANIALARSNTTRMFAPFIVSGKWRIEEDATKCPTAYTDGENCVYGADFINGLPDAQVRFLVMHEKGHEFLMHLIRRTPEMKANHQLFNAAADYVVNSMIVEFNDPTLCEMPPSALYDRKYRNWSVLQVFNDLKDDQKKGGSKGQGKPLDEHGTGKVDGQSGEQIKAKAKDTNETLRQGAMMAGLGSNAVPQAVQDALAPEIDWKAEMQNFLVEVANGKDEHTWRKFDKRRFSFGVMAPGTESEVLNEIVVGIDSSGSTTGKVLAEFAAALKDFCMQCKPLRLRVLWWDTKVHSEQVFCEDDFEKIDKMLRPIGGGGTRAGCVSQYILDKGSNHTADAILMLTDGYCEHDIQWNLTTPTMWLVTQNKDFNAPCGRIVKIN